VPPRSPSFRQTPGRLAAWPRLTTTPSVGPSSAVTGTPLSRHLICWSMFCALARSLNRRRGHGVRGCCRDRELLGHYVQVERCAGPAFVVLIGARMTFGLQVAGALGVRTEKSKAPTRLSCWCAAGCHSVPTSRSSSTEPPTATGCLTPLPPSGPARLALPGERRSPCGQGLFAQVERRPLTTGTERSERCKPAGRRRAQGPRHQGQAGPGVLGPPEVVPREPEPRPIASLMPTMVTGRP
jgi:hypothetical protein